MSDSLGRLSCTGSLADEGREEPYESFKIISKKALADYYRAEKKFIEFLMQADVWSEEQVRSCVSSIVGWRSCWGTPSTPGGRPVARPICGTSLAPVCICSS